MENTKRILSMVFVLMFMFTVVFAAPGNDKGNGNGKGSAIEAEKVKSNEKAKVQGTETETSTVDTEEDKAVKEKDKVMEQKKVLIKQLIEARKSGNAEAVSQLLVQVRQYKEQLKLMVKNSYTAEEMAQLEQIALTIETTDPELKVLPIEKIVAKGRSLKFDTPPVIKDGKVLIPIRAFSQAYGAEVKWNQEENTITIIKEGIEIVLKTDSSTVLVNGVETDLGMPVKSINGRTVMPIGFLAEKLGLKTEVDEEDGTIEVGEDEPGDTPTPTPTPTPAPTEN